jgi:hypothetical protein
MQKKRPYIILLVVYITLIVIIALASPKKVNWTPTFSRYDKIPYGNYVLYQQLNALFPSQKVNIINKPFYNFMNDEFSRSDTSYSNYIIVDENFTADKLDISKLLTYVASGNSAFVATMNAPGSLLNTLKIGFDNSYPYRFPLETDSTILYHLNFTNPHLRKAKGYAFKKEYVSFEIQNHDSSVNRARAARFTVLGEDENHHSNFVRVGFGKGYFYFHTYPLAFTNYHILKNDNSDYIAGCLSYLPVQNTYWDEYYKPFRRQKATTPLRYILSVPGYAWAYYITVLSVICFVIFASKRNQRIIPVLMPVKNLSLEFTRTIGNLYYNQKDHSDLAHKKMTYLLEKVRNTYFLPTNLVNEEFQSKLAYKSNVPLETIQAIFKIYLGQIRDARHINEQTLIAFNQAIEKFYNQSGLTNK